MLSSKSEPLWQPVEPSENASTDVRETGLTAVIADDCGLFSHLLRLYLENVCKICVVGTATNGADAIQLIRVHTPHFVVLDLDMPHGNGMTTAQQCRAISPRTRIILLTAHTELLELGNTSLFDCSLSKDIELPQLATAIRNTLASKADELPSSHQETALHKLGQVYGLTPLELQVIHYILDAESSAQIAYHLAKQSKKPVSEDAVKQTLKRTMTKLAIEPRTRVALTQFVRNFIDSVQPNS